jgi:hypothetical protein
MKSNFQERIIAMQDQKKRNATPSAPVTRAPRRVNGERRAAATEENGPSEKSSSRATLNMRYHWCMA